MVKVPPSQMVCKFHDAWRAPRVDGVIQIEHAITDDFPNGSPTVPGFPDDGIYWTLVAPLPDGRTLWRRIHLQLNAAKQGDVCNSFDRYHDQIRHNDRRRLRRQSDAARKVQGSRSSPHGLWVWRSLSLTKELLARELPPAPREFFGGTTKDHQQ